MTDTSSWYYTTQVPGGQHWSLRMRRHTAMRLTAADADANVGMVFYNPENLYERINLPDSLKCQHTFGVTAGNCIYSDMGRIFASIVDDDLAGHDCVGGNLNAHHMVAKGWQPETFQESQNERTQTGRDSFLIELAKYGLTRRDLPANLNLLSKVAPGDDGSLTYQTGHCPAGAGVTLRFEMDVLVVLHTCPHPMDPAVSYPKRAVNIAMDVTDAPDETDRCWRYCDENARGFANNALYYLGA